MGKTNPPYFDWVVNTPHPYTQAFYPIIVRYLKEFTYYKIRAISPPSVMVFLTIIHSNLTFQLHVLKNAQQGL